MLQKSANAVSHIGYIVYIKRRFHIMTQQIFPAAGKLLFQRQRLDRRGPGYRFHQKGLAFRIGFKLGLDAFPVNGRCNQIQQHHKGNQGNGYQAQQRAVPEHGNNEDKAKCCIDDQYQGRPADERPNRFQFLHTGHRLTHPAAFKIPQRQGHNMVIQTGAQYHVNLVGEYRKNIRTQVT